MAEPGYRKTELQQQPDLFCTVRKLWRAFLLEPMYWNKRAPTTRISYFLLILEWLIQIGFIVVVVHTFVLYLCTVYITYTANYDFGFVIRCLMQAFIYFWAIVVRLYVRMIVPNRIRTLRESINMQYKPRSAIGFTYVTMKESMAIANKYMKGYIVCGFLGASTWLIFPLVSEGRTLPLEIWYPFETTKLVVYVPLYILQTWAQMEIPACFVACSGLFMTSAILIGGQYDILFCNLKNFTASAYKTAGVSRKELEKLNMLRKAADLEVNQYNFAIEHECDIPANINNDNTATNSERVHQELKHFFRDCVYYHRYIQQTQQLLESIYSPLFVIKIGQLTMEVCLIAFAFVMSSGTNSALVTFGQCQYLMLSLFEILMLGYFGDVIAENSRRCGEALLRSPWYLHSKQMGNDVLCFLINASRGFQLTAGRMTVINLEGSRKMITTAFSLYTLLQQMGQRR